MCDRLIYFGRYEGWLRFLAHGVRDNDSECITKAAKLFDLMLPDVCTVIPMPSHTGRAAQMLTVCECLTKLAVGRTLCDSLECEPHPSNYTQKKLGIVPPSPLMYLADQPKDDLPIFVLDNVIGTGATAAAALSALPSARVCALASAIRCTKSC